MSKLLKTTIASSLLPVAIFALGQAGQAEGEAVRLSRQAKISMEKAEDIALKSVPGRTRSIELEWNDGKLQYEVEICQDKKKMEVTVDAATGAVLDIDRQMGKCD
ncbi:MAG: PepSY domain-containing protein [Candidatus Melainabacteria bacterium]|nr:PepSY domain-containing protein [Candidatus Melainabacteria bacterium]